MLDSYEQIVLRRWALNALIATCIIKRPSRTSDSGGGGTITYATVVSNVPARLSPVRNDFEQERVIAEALGATISWILSIPVGTDIQLMDRVYMDNYVYPMEVRAVLTTPRSIATVMRIVVLETR